MCGNASTLDYSPRRLVALVAFGEAGSGDGGSASGDRGTGDGAGGGAPNPPSHGSPEASWRNLKTPMPLGRKIRLVVRNTSIKIKTHQQCCGHPGEPGC